MMAEIVNLRRARKAKARKEKAAEADRNRVAHGTPKQVRDVTEARSEKAGAQLEGHRLDADKDLKS
jgi:hypothetical protein